MSKTRYIAYVSPVRVSRQRVNGKPPRARRHGAAVSLLVAQSDLPPGHTWQCRICWARIRTSALHIGQRPVAHAFTFPVSE